MTIMIDASRNVNVAECEPTALDRQYAAESAPFRDLDIQHHDETPAEALTDGTGHDEDIDEGPDMGDWWHWMGPDADLDARWSLTVAGGAGSVPASRRSMRLDPDEDARACGLA